MRVVKECGCIIAVSLGKASIQGEYTIKVCTYHENSDSNFWTKMKETCGTCETPCGEDHCITKDK